VQTPLSVDTIKPQRSTLTFNLELSNGKRLRRGTIQSSNRLRSGFDWGLAFRLVQT
jgi:hypothetical protein